jgi:hypothetical protein
MCIPPGKILGTPLAADPVNLEEMAAEQNHCPETQRLQVGTSFKLAFHQTGAHCLAGDVSTGNFRPIVPLKFRQNIFDHYCLPPVILFHLGLCGAVFQATAGAVSIATMSKKTAGTKFEISTLRNMIETSGFFHCTHICSSKIREKRSFEIFNRFVNM